MPVLVTIQRQGIAGEGEGGGGERRREVLTTEEDDGGDHTDAEADSSGRAGADVSGAGGDAEEDETYDFTTRSATIRPEL